MRLLFWETATWLLRPLADQGNSVAQFDLGFVYDNSRGVVQNYGEAMRWYRLAAEQGNALAQLRIPGASLRCLCSSRCGVSYAGTHRLMACNGPTRMEGQMRPLLIGLAVTMITLLPSRANATEAFVPAPAHHHDRWYVRRIGPQSCFLMPDVVVALNALGPYCSSPRGAYRLAGSYSSHYWPYPYYVPYYGFYRPWGWSDVGRPWGW